MEPAHIFQRLAKLEFFHWLHKKHSYFPEYGELEIYSNDMLDIDSIIRTSLNALAIRFFKEVYFIDATAMRGKYIIEFPMDSARARIEVTGTNVSMEESSFELIKHLLDIMDTKSV